MPNKPAAKDDPLRFIKTGGWHKYGEPREGLVKPNKVDAWGFKRWNCQACGEELPAEMPSYLMEYEINSFLRICPLCEHTARTNNIINFYPLVKLVRVEK